MTELKPLEKKEWLNFLNIRRAIVEVQHGETEEEAWSRHVTRRPEDRWANIRIFNRPAAQGSKCLGETAPLGDEEKLRESNQSHIVNGG